MMERPLGASVIARSYIPGLNGLRAGAVLMVMIGHAGFADIIPGGLGVTIFFFISGFLITSLLLQEKRASGAISIPNFYVRRFLRLGPELMAFLLGSSVLGLLYMGPEGRLPHLFDWIGALAYATNYIHLLMFHGGDGLRWGHLWSLAVEEHFYLTFPLIFSLVIVRPNLAIVALSGVCIWGSVWRFVIATAGFPQNWYYEASDARLDSIAFGCLTACLFAWKAHRLDLSRAASTTSLVVGVGLMLASLVVRDETYRETTRFTVQGLAMLFFTVGLYTSLLGNQLVGLLEWSPIRWMGQMSYGAYLWHFDVIVAGSHFSGAAPEDHTFGLRILLALGYAAASFAVAYVSYRLLYVPFIGMRHRFGSRSKTGPINGPSVNGLEQKPFHAASMNSEVASDSSVANPPARASNRRSV